MRKVYLRNKTSTLAISPRDCECALSRGAAIYVQREITEQGQTHTNIRRLPMGGVHVCVCMYASHGSE